MAPCSVYARKSSLSSVVSLQEEKKKKSSCEIKKTKTNSNQQKNFGFYQKESLIITVNKDLKTTTGFGVWNSYKNKKKTTTKNQKE